jgi:hypothetical protein
MSENLQYDSRETFDWALVPVTNTLFSTTLARVPVAAQLQVTSALTSGATLTLADGSTTLVIPNNGIPVGERIRVRCTKVTFAAGSFIAYA